MIVNERYLRTLRDERGLFRLPSYIADDAFSWPQEEFRLYWNDEFSDAGRRDGVLVLAFTDLVPPLRDGREWHCIRHQHGGRMCNQIRMIATPLKPRAAIRPFLNRIASEGYSADRGWFCDQHLDGSRLNWYVSRLEDLGLECERTWPQLSESRYPIDATQKNLRRIAVVAPELDALADWNNWRRQSHRDARPSLAVFYIVENSD
jgi:hypothetical protein